MKENKKLVNEIISDVKHDMSNEEIIALLADSRIAANPDKEKYTFGQRAADKIAKFAGSWAFIFSFTALLILWMVGNVILAKRAFDPYPFILLNLVLSCVAALQAPLIMMSQNRQEEKDRRRAENDYKVNLKTEIMIEDIHGKMNRILARQAILMKLMKIDESTMKQITLEMQEEMCAEACKAEKKKDNRGEEKRKTRKLICTLLLDSVYCILAFDKSPLEEKKNETAQHYSQPQ